MATTSKFSTSSLTTKTGPTVTTSSRKDFQVENTYKSAKASGGFIKFPDGSLFRKPTNHTVVNRKLQLGGKQTTSGIQPDGRSDSLESSSGGWRSDIFMSSNVPQFTGGVGSLKKLSDNPTIPPLMRNEASTKALLALADQKANIAENLATFKQTLGLLSGPAGALASSLKSAWSDKSVRPYLRRTLADIRREGPLKKGAQKYLEYVYGWKPLMSDIYGIVALMKEQGVRPMLLSGTGYSVQSAQLDAATKDDISWKSRTIMGPLSEHCKVSCKIWGRIDPNSAGLRTVNQLGLLNPLALSWELMPWSFVVDWFVPIGSVLNALTAPAGLVFVAGTHSVRTRVKGPFEHWRTTLDVIASSNMHASGTAIYEGYSRSTLSSWPLPGLWFASDPFAGDRPFKALALTILSLRGLRI